MNINQANAFSKFAYAVMVFGMVLAGTIVTLATVIFLTILVGQHSIFTAVALLMLRVLGAAVTLTVFGFIAYTIFKYKYEKGVNYVRKHLK
jgi:hypothetical protein